MVENSKIEGIKSDIKTREDELSKRKFDEIGLKDDEEQNSPKRAKVGHNNSSEIWAPHYGTPFPSNPDVGSSFVFSEDLAFAANTNNNNIEEESPQNISELISNNSELTIRFISVKKLGSKLKNEALYKKIIQTGDYLHDHQLLKSRTAYWLLVNPPCSLAFRALGSTSTTGSKSQKEWIDLQIKEQPVIDNCSLFHVYAPKQAGFHELTFSDGVRRTTRTVQVAESSNEMPDSADHATNESEIYRQLTNEGIPPLNAFDINAIIMLFNETEVQVLSEVLARLKFSPEIESRNLLLWRRRTVRTSSILIYKNFNVSYLLNFREYLTLADGVLLLLPRQNEKDYELSDIGDIKLSCATFVSHQVAHFSDQSLDVQYALAASTNEREHHSSLAISAVHSGGDSSIPYLEKYLIAWLSVNLRPKVVLRPNLEQCFHFEEDVRHVTDPMTNNLTSLLSIPSFVVHG